MEKAAKESGFDFPGIDVPRNEKEVYSLRYVDFIMPMVKSIQELNTAISELRTQNSELKNLKMENAKLNTTVSELAKRIQQLEQKK